MYTHTHTRARARVCVAACVFPDDVSEMAEIYWRKVKEILSPLIRLCSVTIVLNKL